MCKKTAKMVKYNDNFLATGNRDNTSCARWINNIRGYDASKSSNPSANYEFLLQNPLLFKTCNSGRCLTCPMADPMNIVNDDSKSNFCKAYNCVYMIQCGTCEMKYVGQTSNALHLRINVHRDNIKKNNCSDKTRQVEYEHFRCHDIKDAKIKILCIQPDHKARLFYENVFMSILRTIYPYGLNQIFNQTNCYNQCLSDSDQLDPIYCFLKQKQNCKKRNKRGKNRTKVSSGNFEDNIKDLCNNFYEMGIAKIKNYIFAVKKQFIQAHFNIIIKFKNKNAHFYHLIKDLLVYRSSTLGNYITKSNKNSKNTNYCVCTFTNKNLDKINFNHIFKVYSSLFPIKNVPVKIAFKYKKSIGRELYNYNETSKNFKGTADEIKLAPCLCNDAKYLPFIDKNCGHIITGDLNIVESCMLKNIMQKGTKFRYKGLTNLQNIINSLCMDLDRFTYKMSIKYKKPVNFFTEWKCNIITQIKNEISKPLKMDMKITMDADNEIQFLKNNFTITYADKAANNFSIICKRFYLQSLLIAVTTNQLFEKVHSSQIVTSKKILALHKKCKEKPKNLNYPYLVLIPKLHKDPITFRTVTMAHNTYNCKVSKLLLTELQKIEEYIKSTSPYIFIKNSIELKQKIEKCTNIVSMNTYDFKEMFNSIQLEPIYNAIINIYKEHKNNIQFKFNEEEFSDLLKLVIFNNYIIFGNELLRQTIGLPQGLPSSNLLSCIFLHSYEKLYWKQTKDTLLFRYIDDIIVLHLNTEHQLNLNFYPPFLSLIKNKQQNKKHVDFLDISIEIKNNDVVYDIYKKKHSINFDAVMLQDYNSLMNKGVFNNVLCNYLLRINNICSTQYKEFHYNQLYNLAIKYHYPHKIIKKLIWKNSK